MTEIIQRKLNDSAWVRWTALILIALTMFFGYMFVAKRWKGKIAE